MNRLQQIDAEIKKLQEERLAIQEQCCHPSLVLEKIYKSNAGNYDPSCDCYWIDYHCGLCDKRWSEDQ